MATVQCKNKVFTDIQAIVFDKDGTLADSAQFLRQLGQRRARLIDAQVPGLQEPLLMAFGIEGDRIAPSGLMAVGTRRENEIAAAAYVAETGKDWPTALSIAETAFRNAEDSTLRKAARTPLFPGIRSLLVACAEKVKIGILSSDTTANVKDFVQFYDLQPQVNFSLGGDRDYCKPDPRLFVETCQQLECSPNQVLMVGDAKTDMQMAIEAGAAGAIGVTWGWSDQISLAEATIVIEKLEELSIC